MLTNNGNSWAGGTFIAAGTLLGNGGLSGSLPGGSAVTNNGTLLLNRGGSFNLGNQISGSGGVSKWPRASPP